MFSTAAEVLSACSPTSVMVETMPTGPLTSLSPASPVTSICRDRRTIRTKSTALFQLYWRRVPTVASSAPNIRPKPV